MSPADFESPADDKDTAVDRFTLEEALMACWRVSDDLELLMAELGEFRDADKLLNLLIGIRELHDCRCNVAFDIFSALIAKGKIT